MQRKLDVLHFYRVYDNAHANAQYQKANLIMLMEDKAYRKCRESFLRFISKKCAPAVNYYDDDDGFNDGSENKLMKLSKETHVRELAIVYYIEQLLQ